MEPIVAKVDRLFVPADDPAPLFDLFHEGLGLPVAWPIHDYGPFRSGGVSFGNCNLEIVTGDPSVMRYFEPELPAVARGIVFEPADMESCPSELDERGLPHTPPIPFEGSGTKGVGLLWTNVYVSGMVGRGAIASLREYGVEKPSLADNMANGGVLGVTGIEEIFISVSDYQTSEPRWTSLLAPVSPQWPGRWVLPEGPGIRLDEGTRDAIYGVSVRVRSLDAAREALMERGLLGNVKKASVGLHYPATYGLDMWFVE